MKFVSIFNNTSLWHKKIFPSVLLYLEFAKKSFQQSLQYRIANYSGFVVNTFFFIVRAFVFMALYENRDIVAGYNVIEAITFTGITQAMIMVIGIFGTMDIANAVKSGEVAVDLMKPIDYQFVMLFRQFGRSLYYFIFRGTPIFLVMAIFFSWTPPQSWIILVPFFFSMILAVVTTFSLNFFVGMSAFWLLDARGVSGLIMGSGLLLSGFVVPISFFPSGFDKICEWLPFIGQSYTPVAIYLGKYTGTTMLIMLGRQLFWAIMLMLIGKIFMHFAMRKLVIQGG
jgi:ABC-2 type transport system permease protein